MNRVGNLLDLNHTVDVDIVDLDRLDASPAILRAIVSEELRKEREALVQRLEQSLCKFVSPDGGSFSSSGAGKNRVLRQWTQQESNNKQERESNGYGDSGTKKLGSDSKQVTYSSQISCSSKESPRAPPCPSHVSKLACVLGTDMQSIASGVRPRKHLSNKPPDFKEHLTTRIVHTVVFEVVCSLLILSNVCVMAAEMQYRGFDVGYRIGAPGYGKPAAEVWPGAENVFEVLSISFLGIFTVELVLRIVAAGPAAAKSSWLWFDGILVLTAFIDLVMDLSKLNPSMMRMLRLLRLARMIRLAKNLGGLQALFLILKSIEESIGALIWSFLVLFFMQLAVGMALNQVLMTWIEDDSNDMGARKRIFDYFGTFFKTMMSMFEITLANWVVSCRRLMEDVGEGWGLFYIIYQCMICFATLKVITAVFIAQTNRAVARDDDLVTIMEEEQRKLVRKKLEQMFEDLDVSHDGYLSWSEFEELSNDSLWRSWGEKLGIPLSDLHSLFDLLAGETGLVSMEEFLNGIQRVKGPAKALDLVWLLSEFNKLLGVSKLDKQAAALAWQTNEKMNEEESKSRS